MSGVPGKRTPRAMMAAGYAAREYLRMGSATTEELCRRTGVGEATMRRALKWLRDLGAPISIRRCSRTSWWTCEDSSWVFPLFHLSSTGEFVPFESKDGAG